MLIVSENEKGFINFDKILAIVTVKADDRFKLVAVALDGLHEIEIGEFDSTDQSKRVIQEIINNYCEGKKVFYVP